MGRERIEVDQRRHLARHLRGLRPRLLVEAEPDQQAGHVSKHYSVALGSVGARSMAAAVINPSIRQMISSTT